MWTQQIWVSNSIELWRVFSELLYVKPLEWCGTQSMCHVSIGLTE